VEVRERLLRENRGCGAISVRARDHLRRELTEMASGPFEHTVLHGRGRALVASRAIKPGEEVRPGQEFGLPSLAPSEHLVSV
jgi:hypothetical protein